MQAVYRWFTTVLFVSVVVQVGLIGYAIFYTGQKLDEEGSITEKSIEGAFAIHAVFGTVVIGAMLILFVASLVGRLGRSRRRWTGGLLLLGVLQIVFAEIAFSVPELGFLHPVNALAIFAVSGAMAQRAWAAAGSVAPESEPATTPGG
jgi:hypothetical protein